MESRWAATPLPPSHVASSWGGTLTPGSIFFICCVVFLLGSFLMLNMSFSTESSPISSCNKVSVPSPMQFCKCRGNIEKVGNMIECVVRIRILSYEIEMENARFHFPNRRFFLVLKQCPSLMNMTIRV